MHLSTSKSQVENKQQGNCKENKDCGLNGPTRWLHCHTPIRKYMKSFWNLFLLFLVCVCFQYPSWRGRWLYLMAKCQ